MPGPGYNNMQQQQQQQQVYDAPNCDYEPPKNFQQNFGNSYDCPEGFYNGSLMSSVGYSQVSISFVNTYFNKQVRYLDSFYFILLKKEPILSGPELRFREKN